MTDPKQIKRIAGQRIIAGFEGTRLNTDLRHLIDTVGIGGLILFSRNIESRKQLKQLCSDAVEYARTCGLSPLIIAIDQEGGQVARLKAPDFTEFPGGAPAMINESDAIGFAEVTARELLDIGINMDMAPVMDVAPEGFDSIMTKRIFGTDPERVSWIGSMIIDHLQKRGVMAVAKHFPGIGRTTLDSHIDRPDLDTPRQDLESFDLIPFEAAIVHQAAGIMLSHIRYRSIDPIWPASMSPGIVKELLRVQMGYSGLVMSDDLEMGALANHYDMPVIIRQILDADVDIALICRSRDKIDAAYEALCRQMTDNRTYQHQATKSLERIQDVKTRFC